MGLNKYIAASTTLSRRAADAAIAAGRVTVEGHMAQNGTEVGETSQVKLDGQLVSPRTSHTTLVLHKPVGYVCSRAGQGSRTIYDLLPPDLHHLKPVGRLDKDSSGLLLMTDDGALANQLTHPRYGKTKRYEVTLDKPLAPLHQQLLRDRGVMLEDGLSRFIITKQAAQNARHPAYQIHMTEGRNRQIRRTLAALGYTVTSLHRTHFGSYSLGSLAKGTYKNVA